MILPPLVPGSSTSTSAVQQYLELPGIDPYSFRDDGVFRIGLTMLQNLEKNGPTQKFYDANLIPDALERPTVILEGFKRKNYDDGLCYCTIPKVRSMPDANDELQPVKPPPLKVFAVYVNPIGKDLFVLDWDWRIVGLRAT